MEQTLPDYDSGQNGMEGAKRVPAVGNWESGDKKSKG
jgi:hypothetical protein